jgi:predicted Zn-dependent protease with MMP-like domain
MTERKYVTIDVLTTNINGETVPDKLDKFIEFLQKHLDTVPEEFKKSVNIEIISEYDDYYTSLNISYMRLETDDELNASLKRVEETKRKLEAHERETLKRLKEKYGDTI